MLEKYLFFLKKCLSKVSEVSLKFQGVLTMDACKIKSKLNTFLFEDIRTRAQP